MAGFAMRNHRVSADRRSARAKGFGRKEIIRAFSVGGRGGILVAARYRIAGPPVPQNA
jgi:hypothetical protein